MCLEQSVNLRSGAVEFGAGTYLNKFIFHKVVRTDRNELGNTSHHEDNERMKQQYKLTNQLTDQPTSRPTNQSRR